MKYLLIIFFLTPGTWPVPGQISSAQLGPFNSILACESAATQAEAVARSIGSKEVGTFCAQVSHDWKKGR